jgi:hypothetical protein
MKCIIPHSENTISRNTHFQALLKWNKHNEQQSFNHEILKNLGNAREKLNVGKPNERDIFYYL